MRVISGLFVVVALAGTSSADLPSVPPPDSPGPAARPTPCPSPEFESLVAARLAVFSWLSDPPLPPLALAERALGEANPPRVLADRQSSLHLCFYALVGLGLLKSVPCARRLPLGVIPAWYHEGGPYQIGHSLALAPDCLISTLACCFTQPECGRETPLPQYRETIVSLWRKSQFTPLVLAARGPPSVSGETALSCAVTS